MLQGVPKTAEIIPLEHDEVILGMDARKQFDLPRIREVFLWSTICFIH